MVMVTVKTEWFTLSVEIPAATLLRALLIIVGLLN